MKKTSKKGVEVVEDFSNQKLKPKELKNVFGKFKDRFFPTKTILIEVKHYNGTISNFTIKTDKHKFTYNDCVYIIDEDMKTFCNTSKMYLLRFHEGFALPYKVSVNASEFKKNLPDDYLEISTSYNPWLLKDVLKFEYAKGVIQGGQLPELVKRTFIVGVINLFVILAFFATAAFKLGWV